MMVERQKRARGQGGFTLIEIIAVLVILGILAIVAVPKYFDMQDQARKKAAAGLVAAAQSQLSMLALFGTRMLTTVARGYILARSSDAVAQKAQMALQRMTNEFSYITKINASSSTRISYNANFNDAEDHTIDLSGNTITYTVSGTPYVLTDSVAPNGLTFTYYNTFNSSPTTTSSSGTNIIEIKLRMRGADWDSGVTQDFTTRVKIKKFRQ